MLFRIVTAIIMLQSMLRVPAEQAQFSCSYLQHAAHGLVIIRAVDITYVAEFETYFQAPSCVSPSRMTEGIQDSGSTTARSPLALALQCASYHVYMITWVSYPDTMQNEEEARESAGHN